MYPWTRLVGVNLLVGSRWFGYQEDTIMLYSHKSKNRMTFLGREFCSSLEAAQNYWCLLQILMTTDWSNQSVARAADRWIPQTPRWKGLQCLLPLLPPEMSKNCRFVFVSFVLRVHRHRETKPRVVNMTLFPRGGHLGFEFSSYSSVDKALQPSTTRTIVVYHLTPKCKVAQGLRRDCLPFSINNIRLSFCNQ